MIQSIEIHMLPKSASTNIEDMERLTNIINRVYAAAEGSLWSPGTVRTTVDEMTELTRDGEIAVARATGQIVGCVRIRQVDQEMGEFGLLAVDSDYQGAGIGRALIRFAEQKGQKEHLHRMQLELLVPEEGSHPTKVTLENWYTRLGYLPVRAETVAASFPKLAPLLATPCQFKVFQKELRE
ncbi:GNAT family N-acetyltransferase [Bacillus piscicola]|uniref:GNAT family N-acetyltransferase n=1 Tax=Bacillus piscicola TaxID=1632684 RepID=UPI001F0965D0|nr:GNAT family N-acetyltransferase [Bacillus piscicola]